MTGEHRKQVTKNIGYRTLYEINYSNTVLTTTLVGTILLTQYGRGIQLDELIKKAKWLRREVLARGGRVKQESEEEVSASLNSVVENVLEVRSLFFFFFFCSPPFRTFVSSLLFYSQNQDP